MLAPVLFLSHGSPMRVLESSPAKDFLKELPNKLPPIRGILIISPHWQTEELCVTQSGPLETIHDFYGFPKALYNTQYPAHTPKWLQDRVLDVIQCAQSPLNSFTIKTKERGLDHGAWSLLSLMYPSANVPVIGLSLPASWSPEQLFKLGETIYELRKHQILIIASGMATHNLMRLNSDGTTGITESWAQEFTQWLQRKIHNREVQVLLQYREQNPYAKIAHPTDEHLRPLFIALGASHHEPSLLLHDSWEMGNANNSSWVWGSS